VIERTKQGVSLFNDWTI